ncbi:MAG: HU family DNA-binding protein, partial [Oxalobacter sp.]|nr:HU family DNA-binding protein [Oxalobacter sp.]
MKRSTDSQLTEKTEYASLEKVAASSSDKNTSTLTKAELTELLYEQVGLNKREAKEMVETFFEEICSALERGE